MLVIELTLIMNKKVNIDIKTLIHFFIEEYFNIPVEEYKKVTEDNGEINCLFWSSPHLDVKTVKKAILDEILIPKSVLDNLALEFENQNNHLNNFDSDNDNDYINTIEEKNLISISEEQKNDYFKLGEQAGFDVSGEFYYAIREQVSELDNALTKNANKLIRKKVMRYYNKKRFNGIPFNNWVLIYAIKNEMETFIDDYIERIETESRVALNHPIKIKAFHNEKVKIPLKNESDTNNTFPNKLFKNQTDDYINDLDLQTSEHSPVEENIKIPEDEFKIKSDVEVTNFDVVDKKNTLKDKNMPDENIDNEEFIKNKSSEKINKNENQDNYKNTNEQIAVFDMYGIRDENKDTSVLEDVFSKNKNSDY